MKATKDIEAWKQTAYVVSGKFLALISTLAIPLILTRFLTKEDYGIYSQFTTITLFITSMFSFGFQTNLFYFYPNETSDNKRIYTFQTFLMLLVFALFAISLFSIPFIFNFLTGDGLIKDYHWFIIFSILLIMPTMMTEAQYVVLKDIKISLFYPPFQSFIKIILILLSVIIFTPEIKTILYAVIFSFSISFLFSVLYLIHNLGYKTSVSLLNINILKQQFKYSIPFGFAVVLNTIIKRIDKIICITYLSTTQYAIYSIAFIGIPGIQQLYDSISQVIILKIVEAFKNGEKDKVLSLYKELTSKTFSYTIPLIIIISWFAKDIIVFLFTIEYVEATPFFQIYLTSFIIGMLGAGIIIRATGYTHKTFKAYIFSAIIIIPLSYVLISKYNMYGAISTALLGTFLPKIFMIYMEIKIIECKISEYFPWKNLFIILVISLTLLIPVILLDYLLPSNFILISIYICLYLLIVFLFEIKFDVFVVNKNFVLTRINHFRKMLSSI